MGKFKYNTPLRIGFIAFGAAIVTGLISWVFYEMMFKSLVMAALVGLSSLGIMLFLAIWSGITYRRENGNYITLAHAFLAAYMVLAMSSLGSISCMVLINKVIDKQYAQKASAILIEQTKERMEKYNVPDDQAAQALKDMGPEKFDPPLPQLLKTLGIYLAVWMVVSLIVAAFIKRGSEDIKPINPQEQS
jgi:hypothetical protein